MITLHRPGHAWPLVLAANRDERVDRAWDSPAAYWPDRPGVVAGRDRLVGGTWMALGPQGMVCAVLNRTGSLGPAPGKRSRGELPLMALEHASAASAAAAFMTLDGAAYRSFNLVIADRESVWYVRNPGEGRPTATLFSPGLHIVTSREPDDLSSPRIARHLPRFEAAPLPEPPDWSPWPALLADNSGPVEGALNVPEHGGFGTVCASLLALPAMGAPAWLFAAGPPNLAPFRPVG